MKILVAGDVEGQWTALNARVAKLQSSKHGPFDALLLCGRVYPRDDAPLAAEDEAFLSGERALPLPCHFVVVGEHPAARALLERMPSGGELSATLRFLGAGVGVADIDGLKVAFASGGGGDDGSASVDGALGADVLLTAEWPQGVCRGIADAGARALSEHGVPSIAALARAVQPRYHFAALHDAHYERPPYHNDDSSRLGGSATTRFIALARVRGVSKPKWLHALSLVPGAGATDVPAGATVSPFAAVVGSSATATMMPTAAAAAAAAPPLKRRRIEGVGAGGGAGAATSLDPMVLQKVEALVTGGVLRSASELEGHPWMLLAALPAADAVAALQGLANAVERGVRIRSKAGYLVGILRKKQPAVGVPSSMGVASVGGGGGGGGGWDASRAEELERQAAGGAGGVQFRYGGVRAHQMRGARELRAPRQQQQQQQRRQQPPAGGMSGPFMGAPMLVPTPGSIGGKRAARQNDAMVAAGLNVVARQQECWFCLSSGTCEKHLITNVGDELYLTLPKGPIVPNHVLVVPIEHVASMAAHSKRALDEVKVFVEAVTALYATLGLVPLIMERAVKTRGPLHAYLEVVPLPQTCLPTLIATLEKEAKRSGIELIPIPAGRSLKDEVEAHCPEGEYFRVEVPSGLGEGTPTRWLHPVRPPGKGTRRFPLQFGRKLACELLGCPRRTHWKDCLEGGRVEETAMAKAFGKSFQTVAPEGTMCG